MKTLYREILQLTEEIECLLKGDESEKTTSLLVRRRDLFSRLTSGVALPPQEEMGWIKRIRKCENRCMAFAAARKKQIQDERKTVRHGRRLHNAYGGKQSLAAC